MKAKPVPLVVTTAHKGVFFGYGQPTTDKIIRLERARMCVYWPSEQKGVLGLASVGPLKGAKISMQIPAITLQDVTSAMEVTPAAGEAWERNIWTS